MQTKVKSQSPKSSTICPKALSSSPYLPSKSSRPLKPKVATPASISTVAKPKLNTSSPSKQPKSKVSVKAPMEKHIKDNGFSKDPCNGSSHSSSSDIKTTLQEKSSHNDAQTSSSISQKSEPSKVLPEDELHDAIGEEAPVEKKSQTYVRQRRSAIISHSTSVSKEPTEIESVPKSEEVKAKLRQITKINFLFSRLDDVQKETIIDSMFEVRKSAGEDIIKQFDEGDNFYVIGKGEVDVLIAADKTSTPVKVGHLSDGDAFGEIALMQNCPRTATIRATSDCVLWAITRGTYRQVMMQTVLKRRAKYQEFFAQVPLFGSLTDYERHQLCDAVVPQECSAGKVVVEEGESGSVFYIIESGEVAVLRKMEADKEPVEVSRLTSPMYFGEVALLSKESKRMATIRTVSDCKFLTLDKKTFMRLLGPIEPILKRNMEQYHLMLGD
ncbi:putative camp-dependent protein kinase type I-beta regulatory subunit [Monocercomonoides exilis]|uniref:putative camp-dependent protein kinase type I-beta regulatory subunit n=1 Tax=Monocercomonoides exilis TaxID=2049356 RepID=UPI0035599383|nr:putative camp-dependent protein kinase type I-beta regulatory subunit [Monocercomonoides exilis]|eukprot:MONOS_6015.1-p1 / transcript=MONOS_6015.1 / gene=MONOS_6015 / organism=Monocercomonoides_exilis_PA203 / gene_product=camp-dependent protein kinase type I-beta regulatory subunit / transcript_product=camp-dependent protein kinase type I-beta regulatory subunit / location=Mono_scaffold00183:60045-61491(+) / protein_length=440 / sequence_SO=supercontig / SO=protein_coding / is_pseudo=false